MTPEQDLALRTVRAMLDLGHELSNVLSSGFIPAALRDFVRSEIDRESNFLLEPAGVIAGENDRTDWLKDCDRSQWHYWPALRQYLLTIKGWDLSVVRSLDDSSDKILRHLAQPSDERFDIRGLVLGYVQSGKTANYTAVIAKAADAGYRLVIVLSGVEKGLRLQTNSRLKRELVGFSDGRPGAVKLPPIGRQWHEFTRDDIDGDFHPGFANHAALQGSQPVLLVIKKNQHVFDRLFRWLDDAPDTVKRSLATLVVDDEADQASVDTGGSYQMMIDPDDPDYVPPSPINASIRELLSRFDKCAYVAYTATPFANILIPHDAADPTVGNDLYPKDFIIDLPKPYGYTGAEELFGDMDDLREGAVNGLNVVRHVTVDDLSNLENDEIPHSLETAILDFVLAGAGRAQRGQGDAASTMLIHTSHLRARHSSLRFLVNGRFTELRDEWRYQRKHGISQRLRERWEDDFRNVTKNHAPSREVPFQAIEPFIGPFFEEIQIREVNSEAGEVLDYENEPSLKVIAIGGNKLSRGLTLEGLIVSYFLRRTIMYDTLMQMGRWFGYRRGYEDLTRIYMTAELHAWFSDLAFVEHRLRLDLQVYEDQGLTPYQLGMRIWQHPTMQVTSPLKRRFAATSRISQSYSLTIEQTFKFPFSRLEDLALQSDENLLAVRELVKGLGKPQRSRGGQQPVWENVDVGRILSFLRVFRIDSEVQSLSLPLVIAYIERLIGFGELTTWTVGIRSLVKEKKSLGLADWGLATGPVAQINRSRRVNTDSLGVITSPGDELLGLPNDLAKRAQGLVDAAKAVGRNKAINQAAREVRPPSQGLLLLYPISRNSGSELAVGGTRQSLFSSPLPSGARDIVGMAISFPRSEQRQVVEAYIEGTAGWRPVE